MTKQRDDDGLRETFQALRSETEAGGVPDFGDMLDEARRRAEGRPALEVVAGGQSLAVGPIARRRFVRVGAWSSAVLAASVVGLMLINRGPAGEDDFERLVAAYATESAGRSWISPTSRLLEVPGIDLMRSLPSIGAPIRGIDPADLPARRSSLEEDNL